MLPNPRSLLPLGGLVLLALQASALSHQDQKPLTELNDAGDDADFNETVNIGPERPVYPSRPARLTIYRELERSCGPKKGQPISNVDVPMSTCASANFTLDGYVFLRNHGVCVGGTRNPTVVVYDGVNCSGNQKQLPWRSAGFGPGHCITRYIWDASIREDMKDLKDWSIMFHCAEDLSIASTTPMMNISQPPPPPPPVEKPKLPRPSYASVSDSACYIPELGMKGHPRFIFQKPQPDTCVNVAALHKLKIYRNALCPNGTEALFTKWSKTGCRGDPVSVQEVDESLIATNSPNTCILMGGEDASSYAFVCDGGLRSGKVTQSLFSDDDEDAIHLHYTYGNPGRAVKVKSGTASGRPDGVRSLAFGISSLAMRLLLW